VAPDIGLEITAMPFRNQSVAQASRLCRHGKACGYHELPFDCNSVLNLLPEGKSNHDNH